jgi:hypothetical protein
MAIQTPWQYWEHNIQNQDKQSKNKYTIQHRKLSVHAASQSKLEKTEGTTKNGQSRDTANIRHTRHKTKTNKVQKYNTTQKKINRWSTQTPPNTGGELRCSRRKTVIVSHKRTTVLLIYFVVKTCLTDPTKHWRWTQVLAKEDSYCLSYENHSFTYILCSQDVFDRPHQTLEVNSGARDGRQLLSLIREPQFYLYTL